MAMGIMAVGFIIGEFFPHAAASYFTTDQTLIRLSVEG
jgi:hypothetical protein